MLRVMMGKQTATTTTAAPRSPSPLLTKGADISSMMAQMLVDDNYNGGVSYH